MSPSAEDRRGADELREVLARDVVAGALRLLGCAIVWPGGRARIVETEAYRGQDDPGCHAFGRQKMSNMALYGPPGTAYVYRSYGLHQMLNVAALPEGVAAGILIRALRPLDAVGHPAGDPRALELRGPGRLARTLGVGPSVNGCDLLGDEANLSITAAAPVPNVLVGPRIGLAAGKGEATLWRFVAAEDVRWVSATRRELAPLPLGERFTPS